MWNNFEFNNPGFLWCLLLIPVLAIWFFLMQKKESALLTMPSVKGFAVSGAILPKLKPFLSVFRLLALAVLIVALARPRNVSVSKKNQNQQRN